MKNPTCPIAAVTRILGRRWTLEMLYYLRARRRFTELQQMVGGVNTATLTARLKSLEHSGLVRRHDLSIGAKHVEYELSPKGRELLPVLDAIIDVAQHWREVDSQLGPADAVGRTVRQIA